MTADVDMNESKQARRHDELIAELLDSRIPKTEREHAAAREIERLRKMHQDAYQRGLQAGSKGLREMYDAVQTVKRQDAWGNAQLTEALMEAEERAERAEAENKQLRAEVERWKRINAEQVKLHVKAEIRAERLAEALETCLEMEERPKVIELAKAALAALSK